MPKQKTIAELNAEKEKIEQQLTQEQHKKQRLENRIAYYERGDRTKRAHNLIVRSADMFIVPDTQEAIVSHAQWDRVQELRKNKRRPVKAERQGLFAGLVYCADCGSKLHFATCKGFEGKQDHYRCSKYKSGRGECSAHYIREDVLRELVLERIQAVNEYIRGDVEGFQEEWLHYRRADQERDIREDQKRMEQAKKRLATLDVVMSRLYEDYALGEISKEKYKKMTSDYEAEQERLKLEIETTEEWVEQRQTMGDDLDAFIALTKKYVDVTELTQTIVNEYIKKIIIHAPDKSDGKRRQKVEIIFNFVDEVEIPVLAEPMIAESTLGRRKRRDLHGHTVLCPNHKTYSSLRLLSLEFPGLLGILKSRSALAELRSATSGFEAVLRGSANSYPLRRNGFRVQKCFPPQI